MELWVEEEYDAICGLLGYRGLGAVIAAEHRGLINDRECLAISQWLVERILNERSHVLS